MIRDDKYLIARLHLVFDIFVTILSFILAYYLKKYYLPETLRGLSIDPSYYIILLLIIIIWYVSFSLFFNYQSCHYARFYRVVLKIVVLVGVDIAILISVLYLLKSAETVSRILLFSFCIIDILALIITHRVIRYFVVRNYKNSYNLRNILIVGSKNRASDVVRSLTRTKVSGYNIVGCLEISNEFVGKEVFPGVKIIGTLSDFFTVLPSRAIDEVIFAVPVTLINDFDQHIVFAELIGITVRIIPEWQVYKSIRNPKIANVYLNDFFGLQTLTFSTSPIYKRSIAWKNIFDIIMAAIMIFLALPLFILISFAIKLTSKGPVFFKQARSGLYGRKFSVYKFRTMVVNAEKLREDLAKDNEMDGPVFKIARDPRITFVGKLLRKTSLDELPQLFNIMKGEMSIVGPRPPIPAEVREYKPWQMRRLSMKPGLTCLWQIGKRNKTTFEEWMSLDLNYIDNWSLWLDAKIFMKTIYVVLKGNGQ